MTDPFTLVARTEYTPLVFGWWLVLEDPHVPEGRNVYSIPMNRNPDCDVVLYPLLGVGFKDTQEMEPRRITDKVIYQAVEYALQQAISRNEPISDTARGLLNWVASLPKLRQS